MPDLETIGGAPSQRCGRLYQRLWELMHLPRPLSRSHGRCQKTIGDSPITGYQLQRRDGDSTDPHDFADVAGSPLGPTATKDVHRQRPYAWLVRMRYVRLPRARAERQRSRTVVGS